MNTVLELKQISHAFGDHKVLHKIDLDILRGQVVALVGPSGCGKSTLLRAIVGTHPPTSGEVCVHENGKAKVIQSPGRDRGIVYQKYSLFPHLTAQENVAFGLMLDQTSNVSRLLKIPVWKQLRKGHMEESAALLEKLRLGSALEKYPHELSGGMCQRVAIAQALIMKPAILLLDEPFGALDEATREELQRIILTLFQENQQAYKEGGMAPHTVLMVTHEINEAIYVSNRVVGLSQYWNWKAESDHCPGAKIVYDKPAPCFSPEDERDFQKFRSQKDEILREVFDPEYQNSSKEVMRLAHEASVGESK
ncbi:MAG: ATP-binding cassette domain-containing protein [Verrucomicrobiota bacterium]